MIINKQKFRVLINRKFATIAEFAEKTEIGRVTIQGILKTGELKKDRYLITFAEVLGVDQAELLLSPTSDLSVKESFNQVNSGQGTQMTNNQSPNAVNSKVTTHEEDQEKAELRVKVRILEEQVRMLTDLIKHKS